MHRLSPLLLVLALALPALSAAPPVVQAKVGEQGLESLTVAGENLLADGTPRVTGCYMQRPDGSSYRPDLTVRSVRRDRKGYIQQEYAWGTVLFGFGGGQNRLDVDVMVFNRSDDAIAALHVQPLALQFPQATQPTNPFFRPPWRRVPNDEGMAVEAGDPRVVTFDYGKGVGALVNEDVVRPLAVGFPAPADPNVKRTWPLLAYTGRHPALQKMYPWLDRPIHAHMSDRFRLSLRFGAPAAQPLDLAQDVLDRFAKAYPFRVKWEDRRPIGQIFLCRSDAKWETNPRGWMNDPKIDVTTPPGRADFRKRMLEYADRCVKIMKDVDAQGVIFWDVEGQEQPHMISYLGDPRSLPPELEEEGLIDQFFKRFTDAGFRVGLTIRPQRPVRPAYGEEVMQVVLNDQVGNIIEKIAHARKRWGCSLFYFDSDVYWTADPKIEGLPECKGLSLGADELRRIHEAQPDVLVIPEIEDTRNYAYGAPYMQLNYDGHPGTPPEVRRVYPDAFCVLVITETKEFDEKWRSKVVENVRRGDILFYRTWFGDSWNQAVKDIQAEAKGQTPATQPAQKQ